VRWALAISTPTLANAARASSPDRCSARVPVVEPDLAAEVKHQRLERRRRVEREADRVQLGLARHEVGTEAAQVLHQHERVLLLLVEPDAHERGEIAVVGVVAQEHLRCGQRRPLGDGVHLDRLRLLFGQPLGLEGRPRDVGVHVPAHRFELLEKFRVQHGPPSWDAAMTFL